MSYNFLSILHKFLDKLAENISSYKVWLMAGTFYMLVKGIIVLQGWEWVGFVALMIGGRAAEYYVKKNGNGNGTNHK